MSSRGRGPDSARGPDYGGPSPRGRYPPRDYRGPPRDYRGPPYPPRGGRGGRRGGPPPPPGRGRPPRAIGGVVFRSPEEEHAWVEERRRKRRARKSKWDVPPTAEQAQMDAQLVQLSNPAATDFSGPALDSGLPQQTRHARRLYLGNLPPALTENQVHEFFKIAIQEALQEDGSNSNLANEDPILSVYINHERRFSFLEFKSVEMTTACLNLDGINVCGRGKVTIKRPNDYNPAMAPKVHPSALPNLNVAKLGIVSTTVTDGPNKIFVGGLHYHLTEDQVLELLSAFGKVRAFHLVKNDDSTGNTLNYSKGYGFVEYADPNVTQVAIMGLNGMDLGGGKVLTARVAAAKDSSSMATLTAAVGNVIGGYNVEELIDAAMGLRPMPTAPTASYGGAAAPLMAMPTTVPNLAIPQTQLQAQPALQQPMAGAPSPLDIANAALQAAFPTPHQSQQQEQPTRILVLLNMVTDDDLATAENHQGLSEEVRQECAKFGNLLSMKIPRPLEGYEPSAVHKIFLEYATVQDALHAKQELAGRAFGSSVVEATYLEERDYLENKLR